MKLSGNKRSGLHLGKNIGKEGKPAKRGKKFILRLIMIIFLVIVAAVSVVFAYYKTQVVPPPVETTPPGGHSTDVPHDGITRPPLPTDSPGPGVEGTGRKPDVYTFLLLATDVDGYNTDVIMAVTFDNGEYTVNVVNIPRDTMVNVGWNTKKANSIYANMQIQNRKEDDPVAATMDATIGRFANILGFPVDFWFLVDMDAFIKLVDAVKGVDYYISRTMRHEEFAQVYTPGQYKLSGRQALDIVRFRGYPAGDIARIDAQQDFLMTAAQQILAKKDEISIRSFADIFINHVKTNLDLGQVIWLAQELFKVDAENILFDKAPGNYLDNVGGNSYVSLYVDEWLEMVNAKLNPFFKPITVENTSIITRGSNGRIYSTDGHYAYSNQNWGQPGSGSSASKPQSSGASPNAAETTPDSTNAGPESNGQPPQTADPDSTEPPPDVTNPPAEENTEAPPPQLPPADG